MISIIAKDPNGNLVAEFQVTVELPNSANISVTVAGYAPYVNQPYKNLSLDSTIPITLVPVSPAVPAPPSTPTPPVALASFVSGMTDDQVRALVNQYILIAGVANIDNGQYWVTDWDAWGSSDPAYFQGKLIAGIKGQPNYNGYFG
jgi:hypothetical protein